MAGSSHDSPGIVHRFPIEGHTKCRPTEESAVEVLLWACRSPKGEHHNKGAQKTYGKTQSSAGPLLSTGRSSHMLLHQLSTKE